MHTCVFFAFFTGLSSTPSWMPLWPWHAAHPSLHANPPVCWCPCCLSVFPSEPQALWLIAKWTLNHNCFHLNAPRIESLSLTFSPFPFLNQTSLSAVYFCSQLVAPSSPKSTSQWDSSLLYHALSNQASGWAPLPHPLAI